MYVLTIENMVENVFPEMYPGPPFACVFVSCMHDRWLAPYACLPEEAGLADAFWQVLQGRLLCAVQPPFTILTSTW